MEREEKKKELEERIAKIIKLYEGGLSLCSVAKEVGMQKGNLSILFKKEPKLSALMEKRKQENKRDEKGVKNKVLARKAEIKKKLKAGVTITRISKELGCPISSLNYWIKKLNLF